VEHAALLAARRRMPGCRRRLRAAMPRHRVPTPRPEVTETERRLRSIDAGERTVRIDVACRAAAWSLVGSGVQIGWVQVTSDGDVELRLTDAATLPAPWAGAGPAWRLDAEVPIELLADDARRVGLPCIALVQLGVTSSGADVLVDLEACATLAIEARSHQADEVVTALATGLASSMYAEVAHLIGVSLPAQALLGHRNAHRADSVDAAFDLASELVAPELSGTRDERTTFELRSLHTSGEMWEPAVILLTGDDSPGVSELDRPLPLAGHGIALAAAVGPGELCDAPARLVGSIEGWRLCAFGTDIELTPIGISTQDLDAIVEVLADAERELISVELEAVNEVEWADCAGEDPHPSFVERGHQIVVSLLGAVEVRDLDGRPGTFERSKTVELIAWLATHRERATRSGARTALWELDVRDATFANVVSEARRGLARLVAPPAGEEWVARTLTEQLPLHESVVTDADLVEDRLAHARLVPPGEAIETLRPAVAMIRDMPFAGTSYLWPDAEGITSNLVLLAITAASEFAGHALSMGDTEGVFWATAHGLKVLPGHEELIGLRMQAHARAGDLAGVRQEWESYERVLVADAWSDGEPAPKLLALRRELLSAT
jgi:Bacterial transcriptional activator domain